MVGIIKVICPNSYGAYTHKLSEIKKQRSIDGDKPNWYILKLKKILRDRGTSVKKIQSGNDKAFPCLRLADAFAGLVRAYWNDPKNEKAKEIYEVASKRITTRMGGQVAK